MLFARDLQSTLAPIVARYPQTQICLLSSLCPPYIRLTSTACTYPLLTIPAGEENKAIETVERIWDFLLEHHITRQGLLINIGGGLTTDLGGFAAATYKRGIDFLNIPTTLLAMVDASSGGKTGFNYHGLKNCIGAFAEPLETIICPRFLQTLPQEEFLSGFAEMLKHALLASESDWLQLLAFDIETYLRAMQTDEAQDRINDLAPLIEKSLAVKQRIVAADPYEKGLRHALNFGHTVGHAIESISLEQHRNPQPPHGYCVLWGMIAELYLSVVHLGCPREPLQQLTRLMLDYYGRPVCNCQEHSRLLELMSQDKKNSVSQSDKDGTAAATVLPNFTLLRRIGEPVINRTLPASAVTEALDYLFSL